MTSISPHRMVNDNGDGPFLETKAETMPLPSRQMVKDDGDIPLSETEVNMHLSPHLTVKNNGDVPVPCIRYRDIDRIYLIWCYKIWNITSWWILEGKSENSRFQKLDTAPSKFSDWHQSGLGVICDLPSAYSDQFIFFVGRCNIRCWWYDCYIFTEYGIIKKTIKISDGDSKSSFLPLRSAPCSCCCVVISLHMAQNNSQHHAHS